MLYTWQAKVEIYTYGSYSRCLFDAFVRILKKHICYTKYLYHTFLNFTFAVLFDVCNVIYCSWTVSVFLNMYIYLLGKPQGHYLEFASLRYSLIVTKLVGIVMVGVLASSVVDRAFESRSEWRDVSTRGLCFNELAPERTNVGLVQSRHHHLIQCNLFSSCYSWSKSLSALNNNHLLTCILTKNYF